MTRRTRLTSLLIVLFVLLVSILGYCLPRIPRESLISVECQPGPAFQTGASLPSSPYFVLEQLILTGSQQDVQALVAGLGEQGILLELFEGCEITGLDRMPAVAEPGEFPLESRREAGETVFPFFDLQQGRVASSGGTLSLGLYQIGAGGSVEDAMAAVERVRQQQPDLAAYADPNYLTGHLAGSPCSSPFGVEGSPFGVEGSPFGVEGSPDGGQGVPAEPGAFWKQWAFREIGLQPPGEGSRLTGKGVQVAVFDTSPFNLPGGAGEAVENIAAITPALSLSVHHPFSLPLLDVYAGVSPLDVKDHGLYVAGLIHAAAPHSQIHLYRVLDARGCGDLYHLVNGMLRFVADRASASQRARSVINLSLGIQKPRRLPEGPERDQALAEIERRGEAIAAAYRMAEAETAVESLHTAALLAYQSGAVIVSAAGNDSVHGLIQLESELPAAYPFVLGVAASGPQGQPACYSNIGDIVAPGAQAELDLSDDGNDQTTPCCRPLAEACTTGVDPANCPNGLISLTTSLASGAAGPYGYAYWVGTSFATPLVSGAAARYYQTASQAEVYGRILSDAAPLGDTSLAPGLIQMPR